MPYKIAPAHSSYWTKQYVWIGHLIMEEIHIVLSDNALRSECNYRRLRKRTVYRVNVTLLQTLCKWTPHVFYIYIYISMYISVLNHSSGYLNLHMHPLETPKSCTNIRVWFIRLLKLWVVIFRVMSTRSPVSIYQHLNGTIFGKNCLYVKCVYSVSLQICLKKISF